MKCRPPLALCCCLLGAVAAANDAPAGLHPERASGPETARALTRPTTDFDRAERGERFPGGTATNARVFGRKAFSQPSAGLAQDARLDFEVGNALFDRIWVTAPASTQAADGLGPLYNARSCARCHVNDGRGHPPAPGDDDAVSMVLRVDVPPQDADDRALLASRRANNIPDPVYGLQLQDFAIAGHRAEHRLRVAYEERAVPLADGTVVRLRRPTYDATALGYGPLHRAARLSPRVAPPMIGLGLLEAIAEQDILANADPDDADGDGISGRANRVWSRQHGQVMTGRFGLKAGMPTIDDQVQDAFASDIGISTPLRPAPAGDCTARQVECLRSPHGNSARYDGLEAHGQVTDLVAFYARHLSVPARRDVDSDDVLAGKRLFYETGCVDCHTPKFVTRRDAPDPALARELIWPYSDLLLHDLGEELADGRPEGAATGREWRTAPLWGLGLTRTVSDHTQLLHDGRARTVLEAILWHGGEAATQRDAVVAMPTVQRRQLLAFLESL